MVQPIFYYEVTNQHQTLKFMYCIKNINFRTCSNCKHGKKGINKVTYSSVLKKQLIEGITNYIQD